MGQVRYGSVRTTDAVRQAIRHDQSRPGILVAGAGGSCLPLVTEIAMQHGCLALVVQEIADAIAADAALARRAALLRTIPGVEAVVAATPVAEFPEPGLTGNKRIAALISIAPRNRDSGISRGQAHIAGG